MGSYAHWSEYFSAEKLYLRFPYVRHPMHIPDGVYVLNGILNQGLMHILDLSKEKFNIHETLMLARKIPDGVEQYYFSTSGSDKGSMVRLLNDLPLLWRFIDKFKKEHRNLFNILEDNQVNLVKEIGQTFYERPDWKQPIARTQLLKSLANESDWKPSALDAKILRLTLDGYSANQIGKYTFRSKRTIEHRIENIKGNLGVRSKPELMLKARELELFGLL